MKYPEQQLLEQQVCDYLTRNPEFFLSHPYVLLELELHAQTAGLPNLALQQLRLLRKHNQALQNQLSSMSRTALENEQVFKQLSDCQRQLWLADDLAEIGKVLANAFAQAPNIFATELLYQQEQLSPMLNKHLTEQNSYLGPTPKQLEDIWQHANDAQSVALYKLGEDKAPSAVLAFASANPQHFSSANDDLLMQEFIAVLQQRIAALG